MDVYHPWNFIPLEYTQLSLADFDGSTNDGRLSTPRFDFESDVGDGDDEQHDDSPPVPSPGPTGITPERDVTGGMSAPPRPTRKPKSRTLRDQDWAPLKDRVLQLLKERV